MEFEEIIMTIDLTFERESVRRKRIAGGMEEECFNVTINGDVFVEFDETFELQLSTSDEDIALFPNSSTINIINNDCM